MHAGRTEYCPVWGKIFLELYQSQVVGQVEPCEVDMELKADVQTPQKSLNKQQL